MTTTPRHTGHALMGTMAFLTVAMLLWLGAFATISANVRSAKAFQIQDERDDHASRALAWGIALLETGLPPQTPYSCKAAVDSSHTFVLTYDKTQENYRISVRPATVDDSPLPYAPNQLGNDNGVGNDKKK